MAFVNYKPAQPLAVREIYRKTELKEETFRKKRDSGPSAECKKSVEKLTLEFGRTSTVHSVNRIFQEHSSIYERSFWLLILSLALMGSIYVCIILSQRFNAANLQTVVHTTNKPVFEIYFPEVVICNENHLNWDRIEEAKARFMPNESNAEKIRLFEMVIGLYDSLKFGQFEVFHALKGQPISLVNNINFSSVFEFMTWRCDELLTDCVWRYMNVNCCDVFLKSKSLTGLCWHFNTLSTFEGRQRRLLDNKYPWRTGGYGQGSGLSVRVMINRQKHFRSDNDKGLWVSVMEPKVFHRNAYWVPANTETLVLVDPVVYFYDDNTRGLPTSTRRCLFHDERGNFNFKNLANFTYMIENCEAQCRQEYLLNYCNCTMDLLFPPAGYKPCKVEDLLCLAKNNNYFLFVEQKGEEKYVRGNYKSMICKCFRNCYSLNYLLDVKALYLPKYLRGNRMIVDLDVHFRYPKMMMYRTSLVFGWIDLLVAFGGIAGLFLGCSLISAIELLYFALVKLPVFMFTKFKTRSKIKDLLNHQNNQIHCERLPPRKHHSNWVVNESLKVARNLRKYDFSLYENYMNHKRGSGGGEYSNNFVNKQQRF